jgi:hypothetical protein
MAHSGNNFSGNRRFVVRRNKNAARDAVESTTLKKGMLDADCGCI